MKRITLWLLSTVSVVVLLFGYKTSLAGPLATSGPGVTGSTQKAFVATGAPPNPTPSTSPSPTSTPSTTPSTTPSPTKKKTTPKPALSSRTVTGAVAQTRWGPVQVQLLVKGGSISKVSVLQYPAGNSLDGEINAYALPILTQETLDSQNAQIDMVSGATVTSVGYLQSLQSALDSANL